VKAFGLTGGIAMGKSVSGRLLRERGVPVVDTDQFAREIVEPGQPALAEVRRTFGDDVLDHEGRLRRGELARRVFSNATERKKLERILHPRIRELWLAQVAAWRREGQPVAVVIIPLLFETAAESQFDATICVACSGASQRSRLAERGWTPAESAQRIAAQWSIERKMALSSHVIWSEGSVEVHAEQLERILS
jgi:dephospho-CoA kinase